MYQHIRSYREIQDYQYDRLTSEEKKMYQRKADNSTSLSNQNPYNGTGSADYYAVTTPIIGTVDNSPSYSSHSTSTPDTSSFSYGGGHSGGGGASEDYGSSTSSSSSSSSDSSSYDSGSSSYDSGSSDSSSSSD